MPTPFLWPQRRHLWRKKCNCRISGSPPCPEQQSLSVSQPAGGPKLCSHPAAERPRDLLGFMEGEDQARATTFFALVSPAPSSPRWQLPARAWQHGSAAAVQGAQGPVMWVPSQKPTLQTAKSRAERTKWKPCPFYFWFNVKGMAGTLCWFICRHLGSSVYTSSLKSVHPKGHGLNW